MLEANESVKNLDEFKQKWQYELISRNHVFTKRMDIYETYENIKFIIHIIEEDIYAIFFNETFNELIAAKMKEGDGLQG